MAWGVEVIGNLWEPNRIPIGFTTGHSRKLCWLINMLDVPHEDAGAHLKPRVSEINKYACNQNYAGDLPPTHTNKTIVK